MCLVSGGKQNSSIDARETEIILYAIALWSIFKGLQGLRYI